MHVLRLTPHFYWPQLKDAGWPIRFDTIGGMQTQIYRMSEALGEQGVDQTILTLKVPGAEPNWSLADRVTVHGVRIPILPLRSRYRGMVDLNISWALGCLWHVAARRAKRVDVVHVHASGVIEPLLTGPVIARMLGAPLVVSMHCAMLSTYEPMHRLDRLIHPLALKLERGILGRADHVVFLTSKTRDDYLDAGWLAPSNSSIVPDSIDVQAFARNDTPTRRQAFIARFPQLAGKRVVAYVGRIAHEKGWPRLLELFERVDDPDVCLMICGDGNERVDLDRMILQKRLQGRVVVTGYLAQEEVAAAMGMAEVLLLVSNHEEFGGVMIEAMAVGTPSLAFSVGGIPAVQRDGETGLLVAPYDIDEMAAQLKRLLKQGELRARLSSAGRAYVAAQFDLADASRKIRDIYTALVSRNRGVPCAKLAD